MKNFSKTTFIISAIILVVIAIAAFLYLHRVPTPNFKIDYSKQYPESASDRTSFEKEKIGSVFTVYYHLANETDANKVLAILEQAGLPLYQKYLGLKPTKILVYIADDVDEYVKIADFPGSKEQVQVGDGSAPDGNIYLYRPFSEFIFGKTEGMLIHEGTHAVMYKFLGRERMRFLPSFLNEGMAHYVEYVFKAGPNFNPLKEIYGAYLLIKAVKTDEPKLLGLEDLGKKCEGYREKGDLDLLCRSQGTFIVWYVIQNYGQSSLAKFLVYLKENKTWQESLEAISGKNLNQLDKEIVEKLQAQI